MTIRREKYNIEMLTYDTLFSSLLSTFSLAQLMPNSDIVEELRSLLLLQRDILFHMEKREFFEEYELEKIRDYCIEIADWVENCQIKKKKSV